MKKIFFLLVIVLIIIPIPAIANITTDSVILNTKLATWNATNFSTLESINIGDGGLKLKATATGEEKNFTFYRTGSTTPILVSLTSHTVNTTTFTINNALFADTMLNVTGSQLINLYLNGGISNSNYQYANGINTISIGSIRTVTIYWTGVPIVPPPTPSGGGGGGSGQGIQLPNPLPVQQPKGIDVSITGYSFVANIGETQNGNLQIQWTNPASDITISSINIGQYSTWVGTEQTPFTLKYKTSPTAYAIPVVLHVPSQQCDILKGITMNCVDVRSYTIPVTVNAIIDGKDFTTTTNISVNVLGTPNNGLVMLGQMIILGIIASVILYMVFHRSKKKHARKSESMVRMPSQRRRQKEGTFMKRMTNSRSKVPVTNIHHSSRPKRHKEGTFMKQFGRR